MMAGVDAIWAYRTLDLPSPGGLIKMAQGRLAGPEASEPLRVAGVGLRVLDPLESRAVTPQALEYWSDRVEAFQTLRLWAGSWASTTPEPPDWRKSSCSGPKVRPRGRGCSPRRAWSRPRDVDVSVLIDRLKPARPLPSRSDLPERSRWT